MHLLPSAHWFLPGRLERRRDACSSSQDARVRRKDGVHFLWGFWSKKERVWKGNDVERVLYRFGQTWVPYGSHLRKLQNPNKVLNLFEPQHLHRWTGWVILQSLILKLQVAICIEPFYRKSNKSPEKETKCQSTHSELLVSPGSEAPFKVESSHGTPSLGNLNFMICAFTHEKDVNYCINDFLYRLHIEMTTFVYTEVKKIHSI